MPRVTVVGNCQAESLRIVLRSTQAIRSHRVPPIHEWVPSDLPSVYATLAATDVLVMQPVRADYRGMPIGTAQLQQHLPATASTVLYPVLRWDGLTPYQAIVRSPLDPGLDPPVLPYHDLRILVAAATGGRQPVAPQPSAQALSAAAAESVEQLRRRESAAGAVRMSDVLARHPVWHTINHPDNETLRTMGDRVFGQIQRAGEPGARPQINGSPGEGKEGACRAPADREMLGRIDSPLDPAALSALGVDLDAGDPRWQLSQRQSWRVDGREVSADELFAEHVAFYREHPEIVEAGLVRHRDKLELLGFGPYLPR
ncbi:hypothetical protein DLJ54_02125 [Corynebacterium heidelbergense]|uniref:Polysaccharide biosynthesis enzyme WcbI domain-containing protein n=1 Tax=Corynebacterium heidelbergense TaxID=2055947 RepID=A0A364V7Y6_9CORY|nr:hypothetical protein DLJ54_02125 [Corynebacterium heidelbergense]